MKLKVEFNKYRAKGQNIFTRTLSLESIDLLLIMCDNVKIDKREKSKKGEIIFTFDGELTRYAKVKNAPPWVLKKFLPENEWSDRTKMLLKPKSK
jgi:hypothetical protein